MHATAATRSSRPSAWLRCCAIALTCLLSTSALSGCLRGTRPTPAPQPPTPQEPPPAITAALLAPCPALPAAVDSLLPTLLFNHLEVAALANECAASKAALARAVRERHHAEWAQYCRALDAAGLDSRGCATVRDALAPPR